MNVLAISCHPDDMEIHCAGTLLKCKKRGDNVTVCHVANGNMGHVVIEPEELGKIRIGEAVNVTPVYYMDNSNYISCEPYEYVDITDEIDTKLEMLACHESQVVWLKDHDGVDVLDTTKVFSRMRGIQCGVKYAEGYRRLLASQRATTKRLLP